MQIKYAIKSSEGGWCYPSTKMKNYAVVRHELGKSGHVYMRVTYGKDLYNHCTVETFKQAKQFLAECTEPELLKYMESF